MNDLSSETRVPFLVFAEISTVFLLTMIVFFGDKKRKHLWLNYYLLAIFGLLCLTAMLRPGLQVKLFAASMLISTLVVEAIVSRQRKRISMERSRRLDRNESQELKM